MTTKREELVAKYKMAQAKIKEISEKTYEFKIQRSCEPFGRVCSMDIQDIVRASATIHESEAMINERIAALGVTEEDLKDSECHLYLGYPTEDWDNDFLLRVSQIHDQRALAKYTKVTELLAKNFNDDDKFAMDMSEVDELGISLD